MDKLVIRGGNKLSGSVRISGSKNTALPLMSAALLADGPVTIHNVPALRDINTYGRVIEVTGTRVDYRVDEHSITIDASTLTKPEAPYELVKRMRASFYMLGSLIGRTGRAKVSLPGGCAWGPRPVDLHLKGLEAFGASIELDQGYVLASTPGGRLPGGKFTLEPSSVGATINLLLAAVTAAGPSCIQNAAIEPDVVEFCRMLEKMGAQLNGIGTRTIDIQGVEKLHPVEYHNCPDRIELGTFMIIAAIAGFPGKSLEITAADPDQLGSSFVDSFQKTGAAFSVEGSTVSVTAPETLHPVNIETGVFPKFPTDLQAQWTVLLAATSGNSKVYETIYQDRFKHIPELRRMGVNAIVVGNQVVIEGGNPIQGAKVMSTDLRASVSLVMAGLIAEGETHVQRVYHLDRGYDDLEGKLAGLGADIERVRYDEWADPE